MTAKWFLLTVLFFLAGGFIGIINKAFGLSVVSGEVNAMMLTASVTSAIILFAAAFVVHGVKKEKIPHMTALSWRYVLICGVMSCVYQRLNVSLAAIIPGVVFFPVANGSMVILSTVLGRAVFKEKLKVVQLFGIFIGLLAIVTIGLSERILSLFT